MIIRSTNTVLDTQLHSMPYAKWWRSHEIKRRWWQSVRWVTPCWTSLVRDSYQPFWSQGPWLDIRAFNRLFWLIKLLFTNAEHHSGMCCLFQQKRQWLCFDLVWIKKKKKNVYRPLLESSGKSVDGEEINGQLSLCGLAEFSSKHIVGLQPLC